MGLPPQGEIELPEAFTSVKVKGTAAEDHSYSVRGRRG